MGKLGNLIIRKRIIERSRRGFRNTLIVSHLVTLILGIGSPTLLTATLRLNVTGTVAMLVRFHTASSLPRLVA